jgi:DNA-directed RNA polymerase sigma subunit (sigma70/sigma32)
MASSAGTSVGERIPGHYLDTINEYPMLSLEDEQALVCCWRDQRGVDTAHKLVTLHLRLVAKIALRSRGYDLPDGEVISGEGPVLRARQAQVAHDVRCCWHRYE